MKFIKFFEKLINKEAFFALLFIIPALLGTFIFIIVPIFGSFLISFLKWDLIAPPEFVWVQNYLELFKNKIFYDVLLNKTNYNIFNCYNKLNFNLF